MMSKDPSVNERSVLLVEDDEAIVSMLGNMLRANGVEVHEAHDGAEGMKAALEVRPTLLVIDIEIPKLSGTTMLRELRERGLKTPALILTNSSHLINIADATELGIKEYLVKADWEIDQVVDRIIGHLNKLS